MPESQEEDRTPIHPLPFFVPSHRMTERIVSPLTAIYCDGYKLSAVPSDRRKGECFFSTKMPTQCSYHCHLGLASNVSSSVSLGEINFPLFVERTVETREDDITGCFHSRCYRGRNSLGLKQDNAVPGDTVSDGAKSVIFD